MSDTVTIFIFINFVLTDNSLLLLITKVSHQGCKQSCFLRSGVKSECKAWFYYRLCTIVKLIASNIERSLLHIKRNAQCFCYFMSSFSKGFSHLLLFFRSHSYIVLIRSFEIRSNSCSNQVSLFIKTRFLWIYCFYLIPMICPFFIKDNVWRDFSCLFEHSKHFLS